MVVKVRNKRIYLLVVFVVLSLVLVGCDLGMFDDADREVDGTDIELAINFAEKLSDHSVSMYSLGENQANHLQQAFTQEVWPYAEATFYRLIWVEEILNCWVNLEPGDYTINFVEGCYTATKTDNLDMQILDDNSEPLTWNLTITNFFDDPEGEKGITHEITIKSYPEDYYSDEYEEDDVTKHYLDLTDSIFEYQHTRYIVENGESVKDEDFDWQIDMELTSSETRELLVNSGENDEGDREEYYIFVPLDPDFELAGNLIDDLHISMPNIDPGSLNNEDLPPAIGSLDLEITLISDLDDNLITASGDLTAENSERKTVSFSGKTELEYSQIDIQDNFRPVKLNLVEFDTGSTFYVQDYFEIKGGLLIEFVDEVSQVNANLHLSLPEYIELNGSYEDLGSTDLFLAGTIGVELLNIEDFDFDKEEDEDNFLEVKISLDVEMDSGLETFEMQLGLTRTGLQQADIDPLNYFFQDGSYIKGSGSADFANEILNYEANNELGHLIEVKIEGEPEKEIGRLVGTDGVKMADITLDEQGIHFEFVNGEVVSLFPSDE